MVSYKPLKCAGPDCPLCAEQAIPDGMTPTPAPPLPEYAKGGFITGSWDQQKVPEISASDVDWSSPNVKITVLKNSANYMEEEPLAKEIIKLAENFGVMNMSVFAAKELARELLKAHQEKCVPPAPQPAPKISSVPLITFNGKGPPGHMFGKPAIVSGKVYRIHVTVSFEGMNAKVAPSKRKQEVWEALEKRAKEFGVVLISQPVLSDAVFTQDPWSMQIQAYGYAIASVDKVSAAGEVGYLGEAENWAKFDKLVQKENKENAEEDNDDEEDFYTDPF